MPIGKEHKFPYDLNAVLSRLVYSRIIYPASKLATFDLAKRFLEPALYEAFGFRTDYQIIPSKNIKTFVPG